jgi:hypothetical protein
MVSSPIIGFFEFSVCVCFLFLSSDPRLNPGILWFVIIILTFLLVGFFP